MSGEPWHVAGPVRAKKHKETEKTREIEKREPAEALGSRKPRQSRKLMDDSKTKKRNSSPPSRKPRSSRKLVDN